MLSVFEEKKCHISIDEEDNFGREEAKIAQFLAWDEEELADAIDLSDEMEIIKKQEEAKISQNEAWDEEDFYDATDLSEDVDIVKK